MADTTQMTTKLTFDDGVIEKITGLASREIDGVLALEGGMISDFTNRFRNQSDPTQGVDAKVGEKQVALDMNITVEYGKDMRQIFDRLCQRIQTDIKRLTGLEVVEINVHVDDVMSKQDWADKTSGKPNSSHTPDSKSVE